MFFRLVVIFALFDSPFLDVKVKQNSPPEIVEHGQPGRH